ncbi:hypothetical protein HDU96_001351 [Phlyctochytrium bullatum]|nr:hypothetical protein HDU96_001351 [Phlyctochytrium bullatum]
MSRQSYSGYGLVIGYHATNTIQSIIDSRCDAFVANNTGCRVKDGATAKAVCDSHPECGGFICWDRDLLVANGKALGDFLPNCFPFVAPLQLNPSDGQSAYIKFGEGIINGTGPIETTLFPLITSTSTTTTRTTATSTRRSTAVLTVASRTSATPAGSVGPVAIAFPSTTTTTTNGIVGAAGVGTSSKTPPIAIIAGGVAGGLVLIAAVVVAMLFYFRRKNPPQDAGFKAAPVGYPPASSMANEPFLSPKAIPPHQMGAYPPYATDPSQPKTPLQMTSVSAITSPTHYHPAPSVPQQPVWGGSSAMSAAGFASNYTPSGSGSATGSVAMGEKSGYAFNSYQHSAPGQGLFGVHLWMNADPMGWSAEMVVGWAASKLGDGLMVDILRRNAVTGSELLDLNEHKLMLLGAPPGHPEVHELQRSVVILKQEWEQRRQQQQGGSDGPLMPPSLPPYSAETMKKH